MSILKKYYCIKHNDIKMSGFASLATVAKHYGINVSMTKFRELVISDQNGSDIFNLIKVANALKFYAKGVELSQNQAISKLSLPVIAQITKNNYNNYFVVIHQINKKGFLIADPGEGLIYYKPEYFYKVWSGKVIILSPNETFESGKRNSGLLLRFFYLILGQKSILLKIFLASIMLTAFGIISAFYFKYLVDDILTNSLKDTLIFISCGMLLIKIFSQILTFFRSYMLLYLSQKIDVSLILQFLRHVLELPLNFFSTHKVGEILSRSNDAAKIRTAISNSTISIMLDSLMVVIGCIVVCILNSYLFLIVLATVPFYAITILTFKRSFRLLNHKIMEHSAEMQSCLVESFSGVAIVKADNAEEKTHMEMEKRYIRLIKLTFKSGWMNNLQSFIKGIIGDVNNLLVWWIGGLQVISGEISLGQLITFNTLLVYFMNPLQNLINLQSTLQEGYVAGERLVDILDQETEKKNELHKIHIDKIKGDIEFKNVSFRYGEGKLVLDNINFFINAGEKVALIGETGCGKTTLAMLLLKFFIPEKGEIFVDDNNIKDLSLFSLREHIGYVPQENILFSGTIRDNIAFGSQNATMKEIVEVARKTFIHDFIEELPLRYDTVIAERGNSLSGGQRQRISIARAILKNPDFLILDEATSNLDSVTETAIHNTIDNISKDITTLIIAHRLNTIIKCDRIFVLDKGKIVESGSHLELLKNKGKYYNLWKIQVETHKGKRILRA